MGKGKGSKKKRKRKEKQKKMPRIATYKGIPGPWVVCFVVCAWPGSLADLCGMRTDSEPSFTKEYK